MESSSKKKSTIETLNYLVLLQSIFKSKKIIIAFSIGGLIVGVLIASTTPKEYLASSYILLESEGNGAALGQMGALAGLAGINMPQLQSGQLALTSEIFPEVIHSRDFLRSISKQEFEFTSKGRKVLSLEEYYFEERPNNIVKKTISFIINVPAIIIGWFSKTDPLPVNFDKELILDSGFLNLTSKELFAVGELKKRIILEQKGKLIRLNVFMPEPIIAAKVNVMVLDKLIDYVTEYKVGRQRRNLEFIEERVQEAENRFIESQMKLALFRDANQVLTTQKARTREEQLQLEFNLAFNVFNSLKQELEQAAIQLKKETPIFSVLEKASVPLGPAKPNKPLIIIFSSFIGLLLGFVFNLFRFLIKNIQINNL